MAVFYTMCFGQVLIKKVRKICSMLGLKVYPLPDPGSFSREIKRISLELLDKQNIDHLTTESVKGTLQKLADGDYVQERKHTAGRSVVEWVKAISRERETCATFMKCHFYLTMICLEGWVPSGKVQELQAAMRSAGECVRVCVRSVHLINYNVSTTRFTVIHTLSLSHTHTQCKGED
jgi:vacuolar-type H+-ATPase subunit I/STV1